MGPTVGLGALEKRTGMGPTVGLGALEKRKLVFSAGNETHVHLSPIF